MDNRTEEQPALIEDKTDAQSDRRPDSAGDGQEERLAALFTPEAAEGFRSRWDEVQIGFVDDPQQAVRQADKLVGQVMDSLSETFANERSTLDAQMSQGDSASTENLRVALRRYRSFFQRLLAL